LRRISVIVGATAMVALIVVLSPGSAWAPVPPKNCGMVAAKGKRFNIKADQIRCRTARRQAKRYLRYGDRPSGYSCRTFGRSTRIKFRCSKGPRVLFAIRR
jgi:hypothetical protein